MLGTHKKSRNDAGLAAFYAIRCLAAPDAGSLPLAYQRVVERIDLQGEIIN